MTKPSLTVIKVGGSLFDWPDLPLRMTDFFADCRATDRDARMVLIAGGGAAADMVRDLDEIHGLGDEPAHRLALYAMDLTAIILATLLPGTVAINHVDALAETWSAGSVPVLAPRSILDEIERSKENRLPASWDVTSDTIAAWLALRLAADRLILVKSAPLPVGADCREAARLGLVDPMLPIVARSVPRVEYLNLRERSARPQLLT